MTGPVVAHRNTLSSAEGVAVESLATGTTLLVRTRNSQYRFVVLDGPKHLALVQGGTMFPAVTRVRLTGATCGGSALRIGWIGVGLLIEMLVNGRRVTSSPVCSVAIEQAPRACVAA
jgi:hypothetical protein